MTTFANCSNLSLPYKLLFKMNVYGISEADLLQMNTTKSS